MQRQHTWFIAYTIALLVCSAQLQCLSFRDLEGLPCPSNGICPTHLVCQQGICIAPGKSTDAGPTPDQTRDTINERQPTDARKPQADTIAKDDAPPEPTTADTKRTKGYENFKKMRIFAPGERILWGIGGTPDSALFLVVGSKTTGNAPAGIILSGPKPAEPYNWKQSYASRRELRDVAWVGGNIHIAVGRSRQQGTSPNNGPFLRSVRSATSSEWKEVPFASGGAMLLHKMAVYTPGVAARILAVGTSDTDNTQAAKGIVVQSTDQGQTWTSLTVRNNKSTVLYDIAISPSKTDPKVVIVGDNSTVIKGQIATKHVLWSNLLPPRIVGTYRSITHVDQETLILSATDKNNTHHLLRFDGKTWQECLYPKPLPQINDIAFSQGIALAVGAGGTILQSIDGGKQWQALPTPEPLSLHRIFFRNDKAYISGQATLLVAEKQP